MGARHPRHPDLRDGMGPVPDAQQPGGRRRFRYFLDDPVRHGRSDPDGLFLLRPERHPDHPCDGGDRHGLRREDHLRDHPRFRRPAVPAGAHPYGDHPDAGPAERQADVHLLRRPDGRHRHRHVHLQRRQHGRHGHHRAHLHQIPQRVAGQGDPVHRLRHHPVLPADPFHRPGPGPGDGKAAHRCGRAAAHALDAVLREGDDGHLRPYPGDGERAGHRQLPVRLPAERAAVHPVQALCGDRRFHHP